MAAEIISTVERRRHLATGAKVWILGTSAEDRRRPIGLQIGAVGETDLAQHDSYAIEPLFLALIGEMEGGEAFRGTVDVEYLVHAPHAASLPRCSTCLGDGGGIDDADETPRSLRMLTPTALCRNLPPQDYLQPWRHLAYPL
jgi:hypothetical protein